MMGVCRFSDTHHQRASTEGIPSTRWLPWDRDRLSDPPDKNEDYFINLARRFKFLTVKTGKLRNLKYFNSLLRFEKF